MAYFKEIVKEVKINGKTRQAIDLRAEVYSYDTDVQKFRFPLIVENYEGDFSLTGAKIRSVFIAGESQIIAGGAIESVADNEISVIVPEQLRGYNGSVTLNVVIDLKSGEKIDISDFKFKMTKSKLDTAATKIPEFYYGDVDGYANQAKQQIATILPDVKNQIKKQQDDLDDINGRIDGLQDLIVDPAAFATIGDINRVKDLLDYHLTDRMPNRVKDTAKNKTYMVGLEIVDGQPRIIYKEA